MRRTTLILGVLGILFVLLLPLSTASAATTKFISKPTGQTAAKLKAAINSFYSRNLNIPREFVNLSPELQKWVVSAVGPFDKVTGKYDNPMTLPNIRFSYQNTNFFKMHSRTWLFAELLRLTDPCDYINLYNLVSSHLQLIATTTGIPMKDMGPELACGQVKSFDSSNPSMDLFPGETLQDWFIHDQISYVNQYEPFLLQIQFRDYSFLWTLTSDGRQISDWQTELRKSLGNLLDYDAKLDQYEVLSEISSHSY
jgi:hypothetical protein